MSERKDVILNLLNMEKENEGDISSVSSVVVAHWITAKRAPLPALPMLAPISDYSAWLRFDDLKLHQLVCLAVGLEPIHVDPPAACDPSHIEAAISDAGLRAKWAQVYRLAKSALAKYKAHKRPYAEVVGGVSADGFKYGLPAQYPITGATPDHRGRPYFPALHWRIDPAIFSAWASTKGIELPAPMVAAAHTLLKTQDANHGGPGRPEKNAEVLRLAGDYAKSFYANPDNADCSMAELIRSREFVAAVFKDKSYVDASLTKVEWRFTRSYGASPREVAKAVSTHWRARTRK